MLSQEDNELLTRTGPSTPRIIDRTRTTVACFDVVFMTSFLFTVSRE